MELFTIVEIVKNYQPSLLPLLGNASTTVEIMRHTSPSLSIPLGNASTIVEIIEAY